MADYFPCEIFIGGPVPKKLRKKFLMAICSEEMSLDNIAPVIPDLQPVTFPE